MATPKRIQVLDDSGSSTSEDDDMPPPLQDMSDSISFRKKYAKNTSSKSTQKRVAEVKKKEIEAEIKANIGKYTKGSTVSLFGLNSEKFNGCEGVVIGYDTTGGMLYNCLKCTCTWCERSNACFYSQSSCTLCF
eukprot:m.230297 g.230297  ORF g.230297 m.230297 type:complete len:134 (+) comp19254_c1_seq23:370-771(+)